MDAPNTVEADVHSHILVVDDNPAIHDDFRKILAGNVENTELSTSRAALFGEEPIGGRQGPCYALQFASQGEQALRMVETAVAQACQPAVAFMDVRMPPGWDGIETTRRLWEVAPDLQVVICTAYSDYSWPEMTAQLGNGDNWMILRKPFDSVEVCQLAAALTAKSQLAQQARLKLEDLERLVGERTAELTWEIAERKNAEAELREKEQQLRQKHRLEAVGSLAGGVAHEFNNLLQIIQGYTTFAMEGVPQDEPLHGDLAQVLAAAQRAALITSQLLGFSRQQPAQISCVDLSAAVEQSADMLRPLISEQVELDVALDDTASPVAIDVGLFEQVLVNLALNARDAMSEGGTLSLRTGQIALPDRRKASSGKNPDVPPGNYALLTVSDTGCGIHADDMPRIFDPFFTTKPVGQGTGMGLAMAYGAVQQFGGVISVESGPKKGTTVEIVLPLVTAEKREDTATHVVAPPDDREPVVRAQRILVAEDESLVRAVTVRLLTKAGFDIVVACDGEEAVNAIDQRGDSLSLVLLDMVMPKKSGHEVFQHIKAHRPALPVIFCTGYDPASPDEFPAEYEGVAVLQKPFEPADFLRTIEQVLNEASLCLKC